MDDGATRSPTFGYPTIGYCSKAKEEVTVFPVKEILYETNKHSRWKDISQVIYNNCKG